MLIKSNLVFSKTPGSGNFGLAARHYFDNILIILH